MKLRTTLSVLERKHTALLKLAKDAEAIAAARRRDVEHVAETIRLLTQDARPDQTTVRRRKAPITTTLMTVLRRAQKPLELASIMAAYATEAGEAAILEQFARNVNRGDSQKVGDVIHLYVEVDHGQRVVIRPSGPGLRRN